MILFIFLDKSFDIFLRVQTFHLSAYVHDIIFNVFEETSLSYYQFSDAISLQNDLVSDKIFSLIELTCNFSMLISLIRVVS